MKTLHTVLIAVTLLFFSLSATAGTLDDYYLQQFGEAHNTQLQKAVLLGTPETGETAKCGMPLKHALKRDWNLLEQSTQKVLAKQLALPVLTGEQTLPSPSGKFIIHYTLTGADKVPSLAWVQTVAQTFDDVASSYSASGWQLAPTTSNAPYPVYLRDLAPQGYYGVTNSDLSTATASRPNSYSSWMELDNNFTDLVYKPSLYTPLQSLQITAAHEYHHAVQYGYNYFFDIWYAEATSTWLEDELYDNVNQLYSYTDEWFGNSAAPLDLAVGADAVTTGAGYGRWIFNRYMSERHSPAMVRSAWERLAGTSSPGYGSDIPMLPVLDSVLSASPNYSSLGADFFGFARRIYTRDWTTHTAETARIPAYAPVAIYSTYPVNTTTSQTPAITLPHYSFAYYTFYPSPGVSSLTITIAKSSGIQTAAFINNAGIKSEITANTNGSSYTVNSFGTVDEVVLLIANTSGSDGANANFSTDGTTTPVTAPPSESTSGTTGSNKSCFIATAAYGSYLHPRVQLLRTFRDDYLLTTAPGRVFVQFYYRHSPPLADFIARHEMLRGMTRLFLTPLVLAIAHPLIAAMSFCLFFTYMLARSFRRFRASAASPNATTPVV